ncbi:hypothetical protein [Paenibacillus sp. N3.4]|uniref:hypothetical protein n=1 Tax=Paenibacillus sp. N3.4 TaxID=2603222 RepID=UPI0011C87A45|nr:hypothetical protein [Paenibacillus sp. N3.4]TXK80683.1 hypothetical protein FU659_17855 [Paenibacillus sp. N3.4]
MNYKILKICLDDLSWSKSEDVQSKAIKHLIDNITDEFIPSLIKDTGKDCWDNAIEIIKNIGITRTEFAIPWLIFLLKDLTWPGSLESINILKEYNNEKLIPFFDRALEQADLEGDTMWISGIEFVISQLNIDINKLINSEILRRAD